MNKFSNGDKIVSIVPFAACDRCINRNKHYNIPIYYSIFTINCVYYPANNHINAYIICNKCGLEYYNAYLVYNNIYYYTNKFCLIDL